MLLGQVQGRRPHSGIAALAPLLEAACQAHQVAVQAAVRDCWTQLLHLSGYSTVVYPVQRDRCCCLAHRQQVEPRPAGLLLLRITQIRLVSVQVQVLEPELERLCLLRRPWPARPPAQRLAVRMHPLRRVRSTPVRHLQLQLRLRRLRCQLAPLHS